ncbi:uncharacterized protein LOC125179405 [Hyalella azteca]|uniref:Uncharacterized protein LOC125179405 n=1 Tax=Hyalella azteca TaxID=294128 RepID=A0A979FV78_HYAAZ|nr:uncharacterized protein LOC125179405 [Hyalella azteca]
MFDLSNTSEKTAIQQLISRSSSSINRSQFVREMELRMCKRLVEFKTQMVSRNRVIKMDFNHNGSRLVRVCEDLIEVLDPRTQRVVHTLPHIYDLFRKHIFEFTDVDHELMVDYHSMNRNISELQLWDMRFPSSNVSKIIFQDTIINQYAYCKKERSLLTEIGDYSHTKIVLYNKSSFSSSGDAKPVGSLSYGGAPRIARYMFSLSPDDSCLIFQPTSESFLAVHNPSFSTLGEALNQFEDGRLKTMKAPCTIPVGLGVTNKLTHMVHDSQLSTHFKYCPRGNFIVGDPRQFDEIFRVYSFNHDVPTSTFQHNPPALASTAQFIASAYWTSSFVPFILSVTGEIVIACDITGTAIDFYHLRAPVLTKVPIDLKPFRSLKTNSPSSMALSPNLDIFVTGHCSGRIVWYNPRL